MWARQDFVHHRPAAKQKQAVIKIKERQWIAKCWLQDMEEHEQNIASIGLSSEGLAGIAFVRREFLSLCSDLCAALADYKQLLDGIIRHAKKSYIARELDSQGAMVLLHGSPGTAALTWDAAQTNISSMRSCEVPAAPMREGGFWGENSSGEPQGASNHPTSANNRQHSLGGV